MMVITPPQTMDNMMEHAKDGRWLGGNTPTGFTVKRLKTGSGKNKSAYSYLESIPEEKAMIQKLYEIFAVTRSIKKTADRMNDLSRIEESKMDNTLMLQELNEVRNKLLSFAEYAKDAQPEELVNLISTVVERIYITTENGKRVCHIFVKGCTTGDYTDLFGAADYIRDINNPLTFQLCDSEQCRESNRI